MSLWKRRDLYWADFTVDGRRYRMPLDTTDWREATEREKEAIEGARQGKIQPSAPALARMKLAEAIRVYLERRRGYLTESGWSSERDCLKPVSKFLGPATVRSISADRIKDFVQHRLKDGKAHRTVNMEVAALRRLLKEAKLWGRLADEIRPLPEDSRPGRALTPDEKARLIATAKQNPEWANARLAMTLALNTTMRGCEIKGLCWGDVDLMSRALTIRRSKTKAGQRVIPLNTDALAAILELRERAKVLCGENLSPEWYVFPHAEGRSKPDPTQPMKSWLTAWRKLTRAAAVEMARSEDLKRTLKDPDVSRADVAALARRAGEVAVLNLLTLRFHDLRHHAITELAESQTSDQTILALAGHVSKEMLEYYSHARMEAKRRAVEALEARTAPRPGDSERGVTSQSHVTKAVFGRA